jgi:hypothetical protein
MAKADRVHARIKTWMPRIWGFVAGAAALVAGAFIISAAFTDTATRTQGTDLEFVYPNDL